MLLNIKNKPRLRDLGGTKQQNVMNRKITGLMSVCIGMAFCAVPMMGQERVVMEAAGVREYVQPQVVQLRAGENKPMEITDSVIVYDASGERLEQRYPSSNENLVSNSIVFNKEKNDLLIPMMGPDYYWWDFDSSEPVNARYNEKGQLILMEVGTVYDLYNAYSRTFHFTYNERGQAVSVLLYNYNWKIQQHDYYYNANGDMILFENYWWRYEDNTNHTGIYKYIGNNDYHVVARFDSQGRKTRQEYYMGNAMYQRYLLDNYYVFYYPDGNTPNVETDNNAPVDDTNKGGFDVVVNIPAESIAGGSFVIKLPEGFTLDKTNTKLTVDFGDFDLVITQQEDNTWLLKLKPKTLRSALLAGEAGSTLAHIAYTVDGKVKRGTYDISVNSIQFETPGGDIIPEPAIAVPVNVNRWGMSNEAVEAPAPTAYAHGGALYIQCPRAEQVTVYSLTGAKVYEGAVQAGTTTVNAARLPKGVYIVAFGDGTRQKVWVGE
jgi:hypothetical protein